MRILAAPSPRAAPLLIALGLAWPFTATADAVASATLSLHEVITRAVQMAPPQRLADESLALAQAQQDASRASLLPQLGVSASQLRQTTNPATLGFNFPGLPKLIGPYSVFDARIKASQKLIDFAAAAELSGAEFGARAAAAQADASREAIASRAALAYIQVLGNEQMLASAQADLGLANDLLTLSRDQQKAGIASGVDVARAETAVAQDRYAVSETETAIAQARLQLQRLAMLPMDQPLKLSGDLEHDGTPDLDVDHALQLARSQRPELAAIDASIRQADAELSAARRRRLPTLSLVADYGLSSNTPGTNDEDTYRYGATLELPIYAGGAIKAQENAARHQLEQQRIQLDDLRQQIEQDVRLAVATAANTREQVRAALSARDLAERELELARDRFSNGVADNVDVVRAQASLARARAQSIAAQAAYQQARVNLAAAQGQARQFNL
ncbi:MAG TPA: TolC family protein [Solimonas sp.]